MDVLPRQIGLLTDHYVTLGAVELVEQRQDRHLERDRRIAKGGLSSPAQDALDASGTIGEPRGGPPMAKHEYHKDEVSF